MQLNLYPMTFKALGALSELITVIRRATNVNQQGNNTISHQTFVKQAYVVASAPDALQREPDYSLTERTIEVYCNFPLFGTVLDPATKQGYQPDQIIWHGTTFTVYSVDDYSKFANGFCKAICRSQQPQDPPTMLP